MLAWLSANSGALQVVLSGLTALVWLAYLQLLLTSLTHQRRPVVLINTGAGQGLKQSCFLSNLGMEPIYLMDVAIRVETGRATAVAAITDVEPDRLTDGTEARNATNQGPLRSGDMRNLGTFETLVERALRAEGSIVLGDVERMELVAIFTVAARERICAAKRGFSVDAGTDAGAAESLVPESIRARQVTALWQRRRVARWLEARREGRGREGGLP